MRLLPYTLSLYQGYPCSKSPVFMKVMIMITNDDGVDRLCGTVGVLGGRFMGATLCTTSAVCDVHHSGAQCTLVPMAFFPLTISEIGPFQ